MHPNPIFRKTPETRSLDLARTRAFGTLCINADNGPLLAHVPFLICPDATFLELHLVRSNPIARALNAPQTAVISIMGPDSYISPDWYEVPDQVPTWNYVSVHLRGALALQPQDALRDLLDRQSADFENRLLPKPPWTSTKMTACVMDKMMRALVPCRMEITTIDSTWKLNQNKPDEVRLRAAASVAKHGIGTNTKPLSDLMHNPPKAQDT